MSKIEANKLELFYSEFDLEKTLSNIIAVFKIKIDEKKQKLNIQIGNDIPKHIISDEQRLSQVIFNLLSNATKFTPENGSIHLLVNKENQENDNIYLKIEVKDSGIGISKEQQKILFQSFQQADNSISRKFGGTGLGLAISKRIVELLGGDIWIDSQEGRGATFGFRFKAKIASNINERNKDIVKDISFIGKEQGDKYADSERKIEGIFAGKQLLLVEDMPINREILISLLESTGIIITSAEDGIKAIEMFSAEPEKYDIIFMDVQMPAMDGYEATRKIRSFSYPKSKTIPIIAMTANVFLEDIKKSLAAGMNAHLGKPINIEDVIKTLSKYI
jgi:CheY-like chemotaxis protein